MEPISTEARLLELARKCCSVNFSSSFLSGTEISLEVLLLRQQELVAADAPQVKGTLWMSVWFLLFLKKEKSAVSAAVLRRADSGKILKSLACYLEKVVLAHHPSTWSYWRKKAWVSSLVVYVTSHRGGMMWGAPWWLHSHSRHPDLLFSPMCPHIPGSEHQSLTGKVLTVSRMHLAQQEKGKLW